MSFLLDTNVISESARPAPDARVMAWLAEVSEDQLFLSVVSLAELRRGVERLAPGRRRSELERWVIDALPARFANRLLPIDAATADQWGRIVARAQGAGRPLGAMDAFLAATAVQHDLVLATRNGSDFHAAGAKLFDPWLGA